MSTMTDALGYSLYQRLANREFLAPYLEKALLSDSWPDVMEFQVDTSPKQHDTFFHPSSHTTGSERWLYYQMHPELKKQRMNRKMSMTDHMTLTMGKAAHSIVQTQLIHAGLIAEEDTEVLHTDYEHNWRGSMDWRYTFQSNRTFGVEMKTTNSRSFERLQTPYKSAVNQLNIYLDGQELEEGIILYVEMGYPFRVKEFHITRNDKLIREIYTKWDNVMEAIAEGQAPKYCCELNSDSMQKCNARFLCHLKGTSE